MPAPFPHEARAGAAVDPAERQALLLYQDYSWLARLAHEMNDEPVLDLKRVMQLVFHARRFRQQCAACQAFDVIEATFALKRCRWPSQAAMRADLAALSDAAGVMVEWIEANAAEYKHGYSINKEIAPGVMSDDPVKVEKTAAMAKRLAAFRALFEART